MITKVNREIQRFEIKNVYEWMQNNLSNSEFFTEVALLIYNNITQMAPYYKEIITGCYDENQDKEYHEYVSAVRKLYMQYVDRNEQGEPKLDERGNPVVTEQIVEFTEAKKKLDSEHTDLIKRVQNKDATNAKYLQEKMTVEYFTLDYEEAKYDKLQLPPFVVGFLFR